MDNVKVGLKLVGIFLLSPILFAAQRGLPGLDPILVGFEIRGQLINVGWHTIATSTDAHLDMLTTAVTNASGYVYQRAGDKPLNYSFGGRIMSKFNFSEGYNVMLALGAEVGMLDGRGYKPVNVGTSTGVTDVTIPIWNEMDTRQTTWENKLAVAPAFFVGYGSISLGVEYDIRQYNIIGNHTALESILDKSFGDKQVLFGFRNDKVYESLGKNIIISFEYMSNFGGKSDIDAEDYFRDLAKYGVDAVLDTSTNAPNIFSNGAVATSAASAPSLRAFVSSVNTNVTKASIGIGMVFNEF